MNYIKAFFVSTALALLAAGFASQPTTAMGKPGVTPVPCPTQEWQLGDPAFEALPGAKAFFGKYDGGIYRIEIPDTWNGEFVLYAHGFVSNAGANGSNLRVGNHPIREHLIKTGFAWAASSYRCNGYVPGQGLVDTMALTDLFTKANNGRVPQRTYLTGTSMGGHVTLLGAQEFPTAFAGSLAMCAAGSELFDYFAAVSAAAEVITGVQFSRETIQQDAAKITDIVGKPPDYTEKGRALASVEIDISGGHRPFAMEGLVSRFAANYATSATALVGVDTPGNRAVDTTHIRYTVDPGLGVTADELNAKARRKSGDPQARSANGPYEEAVPFDGKIERPLLTMHGTGDLFVPVVIEQGLKRAVQAAGNERLLTQRLYRIGQHCGFSQPEMIRAFDDLVKWVRQGVKPEGDDVLGDLTDAGRKYTEPLRPGDPGGIRPAKSSPPAEAAAQDVARVDFARDIQPIFRTSCVGCHGPAIHQNGFRLDRRSDAMRGGTIPVIGPGNAEASRLYLRLTGPTTGPQMPPTGALKPEQIALVKAWIDQGAEWPDAVSGEAPAAPPDPLAIRMLDALRTGNRSAFRSAVTAAGTIGARKGPDGTTPLMQAALYGSADDVRLLLDRGADVNARNDAGATALHWAVHDVEKMRLLVDRGANVNAATDHGRTPLLVAAGRKGAAPVVKLLLEHGANPSVTIGEFSVLSEASLVGEEAVFRMLLDAGADVAKAGPIVPVFAAKAGCLKCAEWAADKLPKPLLDVALTLDGPPTGDFRDIDLYLSRGADVNAADPQGRTVLKLAESCDSLPRSVIEKLVTRGARSGGPDDAAARAVSIPSPQPAASARAAVERSLPLLQASDETFLRKAGCVSCHNNTFTAMTVSSARAAGVAVNESTARRQRTAIAAFVDSWRDRVLQGMGIPGDNDTISYILIGLAAEGFAPDASTDAMAHFLLRQQLPDGHFRILANRPPIESSDVEVTAATARALQLYGPKAERTAVDRAIVAAGAWLRSAQPQSTEDRAFQLLGLRWTNASKDRIQSAARGLLAAQRADGGWSQLTTLESDAYATGQALYALAETGAVAASDPAFTRGVKRLLETQLADGSWFVRSRAIPLQPLFESGFPHGRNQWISAAGTNWAALALTKALKPGPRARPMKTAF